MDKTTEQLLAEQIELLRQIESSVEPLAYFDLYSVGMLSFISGILLAFVFIYALKLR